MKKIYMLTFSLFSFTSGFTQTYHTLSVSSLSEDWTNTGAITTNDDWSGVASIRGFRGDNITGITGADPQTLTVSDDPGVLDVNANQTNPATFVTGGVAEFELTNPVVALSGSGTADAPYLQLYLNTTGAHNIVLTFNVIDIEGSADNAVQSIGVHYRVGTSGSFTNLPFGYIADATTGPSLSGNTTAITIILPVDAENVPQLQIRIMTANAVGNDEWVGIDDISVSNNPVLPILFNRFNGIYKDNTTQLKWGAYTSSGNSSFTVEKSIDGQNYFALTTIPAQLNDQEYSYNDNTISSGIVYYRIAFTENAITKYSNVVRIVTSINQALTVDRLFMKSNKLLAEISSPQQSESVLFITDMSGKLVWRQNILLQKGIQVLNLNIPVLEKGVYTFTVSNAKEKVTRRWVK